MLSRTTIRTVARSGAALSVAGACAFAAVVSSDPVNAVGSSTRVAPVAAANQPVAVTGLTTAFAAAAQLEVQRKAEADAAAAAEAARIEAERQAAAAAAAAAAEAARIEAERQAAAAAAARAAEQSRTPQGAKAIGRSMLAVFGWGDGQWSCLDSLWNKESGWDYTADNPSSSAFGIPQSLPGSKMASVGGDWATNPVTQIRWGLGYIRDSYGSPCAAWSHSRAANWY